MIFNNLQIKHRVLPEYDGDKLVGNVVLITCPICGEEEEDILFEKGVCPNCKVRVIE